MVGEVLNFARTQGRKARVYGRKFALASGCSHATSPLVLACARTSAHSPLGHTYSQSTIHGRAIERTKVVTAETHPREGLIAGWINSRTENGFSAVSPTFTIWKGEDIGQSRATNGHWKCYRRCTGRTCKRDFDCGLAYRIIKRG